MEVLIDTNIILDWFLKREPFYDESTILLKKCWFSKINCYLSVHSICDMSFIIDKKFTTEEKKKFLQFLINRNEIISETKADIESFIKNPDQFTIISIDLKIIHNTKTLFTICAALHEHTILDFEIHLSHFMGKRIENTL